MLTRHDGAVDGPTTTMEVTPRISPSEIWMYPPPAAMVLGVEKSNGVGSLPARNLTDAVPLDHAP